MTTLEPASRDLSMAAAAYPGAGETRRLRTGGLRFFRTIAESVGVQGPTGGAVLAAAVLAGISGGGTVLALIIAAVAMGFVAYAFVIFTRGFNSAGSVYGFTGAVAGPGFGFLSAWALMLVYVSFAGAIDAGAADEAQSALGAVGLHLPWQVYALIAFVVVMALAYLDIKISAAVILALEGVSMMLVIIACSIITAKGGFHGHAFSSVPFRPGGVALSTLGLGIVFSFSSFSGFEAASTLGEESQQPRRLIPSAIAASLAVVAIFYIGVTAVVTNAYPDVGHLSAAAVPLVTATNTYVAGWMGELVNVGAVVSLIGAALACTVGASRILFALGRDAGPVMLQRTSRVTGAPGWRADLGGCGQPAHAAAGHHRAAGFPSPCDKRYLRGRTDHRGLHPGRHRRDHLHHPAAHVARKNRHSPHRPGRPQLYRQGDLRPAARRPVQLGRARRRDHAGRRDCPAVGVPAAAARDRQLAAAQGRCRRAAGHQAPR
jgi:Amino acid permease